MSRFVALGALFLLLALSQVCSGVDSTGKCVAGPTTGLCADFSDLVWENNTYTSANASSILAQFSQFQAFLPTACIEAAVPYLCARSYQPCVEVTYTNGSVNQTVGLPARPCRRLCQNANDTCFSILSQAGLAYLVQCDDTDADGPLYPTDSTAYDLAPLGDSSVIQVDCNNSTQNVSNAPITCAEPLFTPVVPGVTPYVRFNANEVVWNLIPQYRDQCCIKCPNPQYSNDYWHSIAATWFAFCIISLVLSLFTVYTFIVYPERRKWPSILILHLTIAAMIAQFAGTATMWKGSVKGVLCESHTQWDRWRVPSLCAFQSVVFTLGQHAILWWWMVISLNTVAIVVFRIKTEKYYWTMLLAGWVPPFVFAFAVLGLKEAKSGVGWPFCAPSTDHLLYYPIGALGSIGFLASVTVISYIFWVTVQGNEEGNSKFRRIVERCIRPVLFGLVCAVPYAVAFSFRYTTDVQDGLTELKPYIQCTVTMPYEQCGSIPRISPVLNYALSIAFTCEGTIIWAVYSTRTKYFTDIYQWITTRTWEPTAGTTTAGSSRQGTSASEKGSAMSELKTEGGANDQSRF